MTHQPSPREWSSKTGNGQHASAISRASKRPDTLFLSGTDALVRLPQEQAKLDAANGLNTAGFITGYRGSPLAAYDAALFKSEKTLTAARIKIQPAINEALAATALYGTQQVEQDPKRTVDGVFGIWYGKGPGIDQAGDALKHGNALGASSKGGVLALVGDDHGCVSSTMPHQSDQALAHFMMPLLHPASVSDYIPFGLYGFAASRFSGVWLGMKTISEVLESGATVSTNQQISFNMPDYNFPHGGLHNDMTKAFGIPLEERMLARLRAFDAFAKANPIDRPTFGAKQPSIAIIGVGKAYMDALAALKMLGIDEETALAQGIGIYKVGLVWPIESDGYRQFLKNADRVVVVEEKRSFVEAQLKELFFNLPQEERPIILGKRDEAGESLIPEGLELRPAMIAPLLCKALDIAPNSRPDTITPRKRPVFKVPNRTPHFCSGCPHNRSTKLPEGSEANAGIGCHIMASWMDRNTGGLTQMGGEGVNWLGNAPFTKKPHMFQNLGDGTYYHSGLLAIRQAVAAKTSITYKILFNDAVAMTGGQAFDGPMTVEDIVAQVRAEGISRIAIVSDNPNRFAKSIKRVAGITIDHRDNLDTIQRTLCKITGVTVLIYDQGCAAEKRRKRKRGLLEDPKKRVFINQAVCEGCGDCSVQSNCMSVIPTKTEWGVKRTIDQSSCNKDFSCVKGFCPSFVTIGGEEERPTGDDQKRHILMSQARDLAEPDIGTEGKILIAGIGGTGVVTIGAVLAHAANEDGKTASVLDFMGLAQKGGAVVSHLKIRANPNEEGPVRIDHNGADTMIGCDLVVATMSDPLKTLSSEHCHIIANSAVQPTADFVLRGIADFEEMRRVKHLSERARKLDIANASDIAVQLFGDSVFSNMILTGMAWQKGRIPISRKSILAAIEKNGRSVNLNVEAFELGRLLIHDNTVFQQNADTSLEPQTLDALIANRVAFLTDYQDARYAETFRTFMDRVIAAEKPLGSEQLSLTSARQLSRLMAYKDEFEVARLHLHGNHIKDMKARYKNGSKLTFHLAPPLLSFMKDPDGRPRKFALPGSVVLPVLKFLRRMRPLRGTPFNVFGWSQERRTEAELISQYKALIDGLLTNLTAQTLEKSIETAGLIDTVRGYGPVKAAALAAYRQKLSAHQNAVQSSEKKAA
ncbi:MAG: indolepyruvate ferredoxin oxidoreductase family protein [Hyphomicrobiales bacterium]